MSLLQPTQFLKTLALLFVKYFSVVIRLNTSAWLTFDILTKFLACYSIDFSPCNLAKENGCDFICWTCSHAFQFPVAGARFVFYYFRFLFTV